MSDRRRIGLIGVGRMGLPICARLAGAGHTLIATDIAPETRPAVVAAGAAWAGETAEVAAGADVVITVLPGWREVESLAGALVGSLAPGTLWIDMSTASPQLARRIAPLAGHHGVRLVDAPVGGGPEAAREGRLLSFAGGTGGDVAAARTLLRAVAHRVVHVGEHGSGYALKLLANGLWFGQAVAVAEALTLASRAGIDPELAREALADSAAGSRFLDDGATALLRGDDLTSFPLARCCEQLATVLELGDELAVPVELGALVSRVHHDALTRYGDVDGELLGGRLVAERAGVSFGPR